MQLRTELERFRADFMASAPPEIRAALARADLDLAASDLVGRALKAGDAAPDFALPEAHGGTVRLAALLTEGPAVVSFYRGGWCPYCSLELRALQQALPEIRRRGGTLAALSPETRGQSFATVARNGLTFPVLSDPGAATAAAFGLVFDLANELRPIFTHFGHALPDRNGDDSWRLPIPATYVVDRQGTIALAFLDVDYSRRLEPAEIIAAVAALAAG